MMNNYSIYIIAAYSITFFVFGLNIVISFAEKKRIKKIINQTRSHEC